MRREAALDGVVTMRWRGMMGWVARRDSMMRKRKRVQGPRMRRVRTVEDDQGREVAPRESARRSMTVPELRVRPPSQSRAASPARRCVRGVWILRTLERRRREAALHGTGRYHKNK
jgi:hypothetical protein